MIPKSIIHPHSLRITHNSSLTTTLLALILVTAVGLSCRLAKNLAGNPSAGTVSSLWPDVPPLAGATKADLEIPLAARLAIRAFMQGKVNFIAFTADQSAADVQAFYSNDRMKASGWTADRGCIADSDEKEHPGAMCLFKRKDGTHEEGLAIVVGQDEKTKKTEVFYVRIELPEPSPSPNR